MKRTILLWFVLPCRWYKADTNDYGKQWPRNISHHKCSCMPTKKDGWHEAVDREGCRPGGLLRKKSGHVYDMFRTHMMESIRKKLGETNTDVAIIPGDLTSQLQPLDVSLNKPFKGILWTAGDKDHELTPGGRLKRPSITLWCRWVLTAWEKVATAIVIKSFKKCSISNALDGTEDGMLLITPAEAWKQ